MGERRKFFGCDELLEAKGRPLAPIRLANADNRSYAVGGACMPVPPIYRPMVRRCAPQADKSAVRQ